MNWRGRQWLGLVERPQHTVLVLHTPFFLLISFELCTKILFQNFFFCFSSTYPSCSYSFLLLSDDSAEEEAPKLQTKEERDIDTLLSWVQLGGFPAQPEEEEWGLLIEVNLIYLFYLYLQVTFCSATPLFAFYFLFMGLNLLK